MVRSTGRVPGFNCNSRNSLNFIAIVRIVKTNHFPLLARGACFASGDHGCHIFLIADRKAAEDADVLDRVLLSCHENVDVEINMTRSAGNTIHQKSKLR